MSGVTATFSGPLFGNTDRIVEQRSRELVEDASDEGAKLVRAQLRPGHGVKTGDFKGGVRGRVRSSSRGGVEVNSTVKAAALEKRYGIFTRGRDRLERGAGAIARKHGRLLARELGGS